MRTNSSWSSGRWSNKFEIKSFKFDRIPKELKTLTDEQRAEVNLLLDKINEDEDNDFLTEEDSIDNQISSNEKTNNNTKIVYYKDKREPLADVMQQDLTTGEWGYIESEKTGKLVPTPISPRVDIPGENVGAFYDDDEQGIIVRVDDESKLEELKEFAQYYDRPFETGYDKHVVGPKYFIKIKLEEKDWDEPYKDSRVHVRSEFVKS